MPRFGMNTQELFPEGSEKVFGTRPERIGNVERENGGLGVGVIDQNCCRTLGRRDGQRKGDFWTTETSEYF